MMTSAASSALEVDDSVILGKLLSERWSSRAFLDEDVPRATIERLLQMAQRTASWCNTQSWEVIVTSGQGTERFREAMMESAGKNPAKFDLEKPTEYRGVYRERRRASGWQLYEAVGVARGDREASAQQSFENYRFFGAPHVAILTTDADHGVYGAVDAGMYVDSFLLAARSLGLGAIPQAALAGHSALIRKHFEIPEDRKILLGISFGYADESHPANSYRTSRAPLTDVVTWVDG
ncbi:nitroreductase [Glutamicibacter sp.]|uniref:nitroreductase n=1 Tax=Glutamicibacter sp. TaxID=1931995 RepID=UPI002B488B70|nr:nitroreductase [Glutamicibacter sp.]HJX79319.1 nitroreductase [Glutamicibacter sp.]